MRQRARKRTPVGRISGRSGKWQWTKLGLCNAGDRLFQLGYKGRNHFAESLVQRSMPSQLFPKRIVDVLGRMRSGVTGPVLVRADDGLTYVAKHESGHAPSIRASEFIWISIAGLVGLPAPTPEVLIDNEGRSFFGTRREVSAIDAAIAQMSLLSGRVLRGGAHLSRIYAFDLFAANWDRNAGNYLVLDDGGGSLALFAIDFSHVSVHPGMAPDAHDPMRSSNNATRGNFPQVVAPYGSDIPAALEIADRLTNLPIKAVDVILTELPPDWLAQPERDSVRSWWDGRERSIRAAALSQGLQNGTLI